MMTAVQLFLLPFAGGDSNSFKNLEKLLSPEIEAIPICYPGRGVRRSEAYKTSYDDALKDITLQINSRRKENVPYSLLGYSIGSIYSYDLLARELVDGECRHAFLCSKGSVARHTKRTGEHDLSDEELADRILGLGGTSEKLMQDVRFRKIFLAPIRADYFLYDQFVFSPGKMPTDISVIYSPKDENAEGVEDWKQLTEGRVYFYPMGDNHFFIYEHWQDVADIVNGKLGSYL